MENYESSTACIHESNFSGTNWYDVIVTQTTTALPLGQIEYIYVTVTFFYSVVFLIGVLGNILVICVVCAQRDMRTPTNMFLVNLSVADLLVLFFCMPSSLVEFHAQEVWLLGEAMCKLTFFLEHAVAHTSILTILAISFERYYAICCPLQVLYTCTLRRAIKINVAVWFCGLLSAVPFIVLAFTESVPHVTAGQADICRLPITNAWSRAYVIAIQQLFFTVPFVVLVALYVVICRSLLKEPIQLSPKHADCPQEQTSPFPLHKTMTGASMRSSYKSTPLRRRHISARHQILYVVITIMILFFVCLLPLRVVTFWLIYSPEEDKERLGLEGYMNLMAFVRIMFYLNSAANPILYNLVSTKFRQAGRRLFCCQSKRSRPASYASTNYRPVNDRARSSKARSNSTSIITCQRIDSAAGTASKTTHPCQI